MCIYDSLVVDDTLAVAREAVQRHGRRFAEPELLRSGANDVYVASDVVVRVARTTVDVDRHVAIGEVLRREGVPVPKPIASGQHSGTNYSVWEYVRPDVQSVVQFEQFGAGIRLVHGIDPAVFDAYDLPWCDKAEWLALDRVLDLVKSAALLPDDDVDLLASNCDRLRGWGDRCRAAGRAVVCHGDVHPQNVVVRNSRATIIDWDTICIGPPQWDHAALLTWAERWGGHSRDYWSFAEGYGETFASDPLAMELAEIRLLAPTLNMIVKGAASKRHANEAGLRMRFWRGELDPPTWTPQ